MQTWSQYYLFALCPSPVRRSRPYEFLYRLGETGCPHWLVNRTFQAVFPHTFWRRKKKPFPPLPPRCFPNPIRLAQRWQTLIDEGVVVSKAQLARNLGCSRARVTQILGLLKLPPDEIEYLAAKGEFLSDKNLCERRLRELMKKQVVLP